jgi:hypothetical protein
MSTTSAPLRTSMVTQPIDNDTALVWCAECAWMGTVSIPDSPWHAFRGHTCPEVTS